MKSASLLFGPANSAHLGCRQIILLGFLLLAGASSAIAGAINCPGTLVTTDREFTLTTSITASCLASGTGNINGNGDAINALGYVTIDKSDDNTSGLTPFNWLTITGLGTTSGTFSLLAPVGYSNFVLALKSGEGQLDPDWTAFLLPAGVTSGNWSISGNQSLARANLYGGEGGTLTRTTVPEPGSMALLSIALLGFGLARRRRKIW